MLKYLIQRLLMAIPVILGVTIIVFIIMQLTPGDPLLNTYGVKPTADPSFIVELRSKLGVDDPIHIQYGKFLLRLMQGDLGRSIVSNIPVLDLIIEVLPNTLILLFSSVILATLLGIPTGVISALKYGTRTDHLIRITSILSVSLPDFWLGIVLVIIFSYYLGVTPVAGYGTVYHLILPTITLAAGMSGVVARLTRASLLETIKQDFIKAAKARGLNKNVIIWNHALRIVLIPVITVLGLQVGYLIAGAFFVEWIFGWPGIGRLTVSAILERDYPVIMGSLLLITLAYVLINLIVDITYAYLDPRVRYENVLTSR